MGCLIILNLIINNICFLLLIIFIYYSDIVATTEMPPYETGSSTYGLLILMDSLLFINEEKILPRYKQIYVETINHEIAHQWIGNTLKMEWFDTLWVIEGLVGYMEKKIDAYENRYSNVNSFYS